MTIILQIDEPISLVSLESQACGTPVISSYPEESIQTFSSGFTASSANIMPLIRSLFSSYHGYYNFDKYQKLCEKALENAQNYYLKNLGAKIIEYIENYLEVE